MTAEEQLEFPFDEAGLVKELILDLRNEYDLSVDEFISVLHDVTETVLIEEV
jgi:hypothetical protein